MKPQVFGECEVELKFFCVLENLAQMGCPAFPFIDQGKDQGYTREREKEEKKEEEKRRRREPRGIAALLHRWVQLVL
jgi:hypothetical protein